MAIRRRYLKFFPILLFVPALVLAEVAGPPLPLSLEKGPLPFDCAICHDQMARRLEHSPCRHELPGAPRPETGCYRCHVETRQACLLRKDEDRLCRTCHKGY